MAVHAAAARTLNIPLGDLLGGRFRERVRLYVSSIPGLGIELDEDAVARYTLEE